MTSSASLLISASPLKTQSHLTAIKFARTAFSLGRNVGKIFFYSDAVQVANYFSSPPSDEPQIRREWILLAKELEIELQVCVAASLRRGILDSELVRENIPDDDNEDSNKTPSFTADQNFNMAGLGQLAAAMREPTTNLIHFK